MHVLVECAARFERTAILFSGGKDSIVLCHLARLAFHPARIPFVLLHIDTGHNFVEALEFRDAFVQRYGFRLEVRLVQESIDRGRVTEEPGPIRSRNALQTVTLLDAIAELKLDAAIGGARRDEEKARAKERIFSHRNGFGVWEPSSQRPEPWNLFDMRKAPGEHFRVFPLSNWTELDVWRYIEARQLELPSLYFVHDRQVFQRSGVWLAVGEPNWMAPDTAVEERRVRFRTVGDMTCTAAIESAAASVDEVIRELEATRRTERSTRVDDKRSEAAMEDRKKTGYF